jgi:transcriptional regulator with XRE-family HTH domain
MTLRQLRESRGYSQNEVAAALGVKSIATVANWEHGRTEPELSTKRRLAEFFGVSFDEMNLIVSETRQQAT